MSIVAALMWKKSPVCSISTLVFDEASVEIHSAPKITYFSPGYLKFRREVKKVIKSFFMDMIDLHQSLAIPIRIEYKIVFPNAPIPFLTPARESRYVYKIFQYWIKKTKKIIKDLRVGTQLRKKLAGKPMRLFNRELRALRLVRRKADTKFEYSLWAVALHATEENYESKIEHIRDKLMNEFWQSY